MSLRTSQSIWVVLYFIFLENLYTLALQFYFAANLLRYTDQNRWRPYTWESRHWAHFSPRQVSVQCDSRERRFCTMRMVKTWYVRSLVLTERLILNSSCTQARKKKHREMLTSLLTLRDIHVCNTGLYKLSQKGLWSDTSPWCSLSERARTLI